MTDPATDAGSNAEFNDITVSSGGVVVANGNPSGADKDGLWAVPTPSNPMEIVPTTLVNSFFDNDVNSIPEFGPNDDVIYYVIRGNDGSNQIWSLPLPSGPLGTAGTATQLTFFGDFPRGANAPKVTPDGSTIVFGANQVDAPDAPDQLYSIPASGGTPTRLMTSLQGDSSEGEWDITADGLSVVVSPSVDGVRTNILSIPVGGGPAVDVPIVGAPAFAEMSESLRVSADNFVYFIGDYLTDDVEEVFRVPLTGGTPQRMSDLVEPFSDVESLALSPDGSVLAYVVDIDTDGVNELYVTPTDGLLGRSVKISDPVGASTSPDVSGADDGGIVFSADGSRMYYLADFEVTGLSNLYVVDVPAMFPAAQIGDYNDDGLVDAADYTVWRDSANQTGPGLAADGNGDEVVDRLDYDLWVSTYGMSAASLAQSVPEPGTLPVLFAGTLALGAARSHQR